MTKDIFLVMCTHQIMGKKGKRRTKCLKWLLCGGEVRGRTGKRHGMLQTVSFELNSGVLGTL